jgi:hypothetical protein
MGRSYFSASRAAWGSCGGVRLAIGRCLFFRQDVKGSIRED